MSVSHVHSSQGNSVKEEKRRASSRIELLRRRGKARGVQWEFCAHGVSVHLLGFRRDLDSVGRLSSIRAQFGPRSLREKVSYLYRYLSLFATQLVFLTYNHRLFVQFWSSIRMFSPKSQGFSGSVSNQEVLLPWV